MQRGVRVLQRFHRKSNGIVLTLILRKLGMLLREPGFKLGGIADGAAAAGGVIEGALRLTAAAILVIGGGRKSVAAIYNRQQ